MLFGGILGFRVLGFQGLGFQGFKGSGLRGEVSPKLSGKLGAAEHPN